MSEFEKWFKSLNENGRVTYFLGQEGKIAEEAWSHRQSEIDQLKGRISYLESAKKGYRDQVLELREECDQLKAEKAGLEKRVEGALSITKKMATQINLIAIWALDLDKALRGANDHRD